MSSSIELDRLIKEKTDSQNENSTNISLTENSNEEEEMLLNSNGSDLEINGPNQVDNNNTKQEKPGADAKKKKYKIKPFWVCVSLVLFLITYFIPILKYDAAAHKCLAILIFVVVMWSSEAVPLFVTSLFVPIPIIVFSVILDDTGKPMNLIKASKIVSNSFFDPVILLFLGGFTMAHALQKYNLSQRLANFILKKAGTNPKRILAYVMLLSWFLSSWISNVASAVVTTSILLPIIRNSIPHGDNFQKALLIGNALSNSVAGMNTLIASPQNAIAIKVVKQISKHEMSIGFINWMGFGIPCSIVICTLVYLWILYVFPTKLKEIHLDIEKEPEMTKDQYIIVITTIVTVLLMCVNSSIDKYVGDIGITALIPLVVFFGLGLLETQDLGELSWSVLLLIGGGLVLGDGVELSNLLHIISEAVGDLVASQSMWVICLAFMILAGSIGIAISSTVCAVIILPVIGVVGHKYKHLILLTSLVTSVASGSTTLPISSFPNSVAYAVLDKKGDQYLTVKDYLKSGSVSSFLTLVILVTIGYGINLKMGW